MVTGQCLCGEVRYRIDGHLSFMRHCHCSMCRKLHGSTFATFVSASASDFEWTHGEEKTLVYESSPGMRRVFCSNCGSMVPGTSSKGGGVFVPAGTLGDSVSARPEAHIFVASKAPWYEIHDDLPQNDAYPSADGRPAMDGPQRAAETEGAVAGSCLCGKVRFEFTDQPFALVNCHCSRCRRGRGAAHASNLFIRPEQLRWLSGEDEVTIYDLPGAVRFGINFCNTCGSCVPRFSESAGRVNVPMGSLDTDPGMSPTRHIFVGSKAPWFEIKDDLPQFETEAT